MREPSVGPFMALFGLLATVWLSVTEDHLMQVVPFHTAMQNIPQRVYSPSCGQCMDSECFCECECVCVCYCLYVRECVC